MSHSTAIGLVEAQSPFHVKSKSDDQVLAHFLRQLQNCVAASLGGTSGAALAARMPPNGRLEATYRSEQEALEFLSGLLPEGDAILDLLQKDQRMDELLRRCPEILADGLMRPDLASLVAASRRGALSCWELYRWAEESFLRNDLAVLRRSPGRVILQWEAEISQRRIPWLWVIFGTIQKRFADVLAESCQVAPSNAHSSTTDVLGEKLNTLVKHLVMQNDHDSLIKLAILIIPGLSMNDARELLQPGVLKRDSWVRCVHELTSAVETDEQIHLHVYVDDEEEQLLETLLGPRQAAANMSREEAERRLRARRLREIPSARLLWSQEVQEHVAVTLWECWAHHEMPTFHPTIYRIHEAMRRRFKQTADRSAQRSSLIVRLLLTMPKRQVSGTGAQLLPKEPENLYSAWVRCVREILAYREREDPNAEAKLHRWLAPHLAAMQRQFDHQMPPELRRAWVALTYLEAEFRLVTCWVTHTTLGRASRFDKDALDSWFQNELEGIERIVGTCVNELESITTPPSARTSTADVGAHFPKWLRLAPKHALVYATALLPKPGDSSRPSLMQPTLDQLRSLKTAPQDGSAPDLTLVDGITSDAQWASTVNAKIVPPSAAPHPSLLGNLRFLERNGKLSFSVPSLLVAAAAHQLYFAANNKEPAPYVALARWLLLKALGLFENPFRERSYLLVRCMLAIDCRIVERNLPDMTFISPILADVHRKASYDGRTLLLGLIRDVTHKSLVDRETTRRLVFGSAS